MSTPSDPPSPDTRRLVIESVLKDGTHVCLRTIRPSDEERIRAGIAELSDRSRYLRFFSAFRDPPPAIVKRLSAVDGHDHIGWGAIRTDLEEPHAIGAAHAIRSADLSLRGELAVALLDEYHGLGLARMLIAAVLVDCALEGIEQLEMQMIAENQPASRLVTSLGAQRKPALDSAEHYELDVSTAIATLSDPGQPRCVQDVFKSHLPPPS